MRDEKEVGCPGDVREMGEGGWGLGGGVGGGIKAMMTVLYCRVFDQSLTLPYICSGGHDGKKDRKNGNIKERTKVKKQKGGEQQKQQKTDRRTDE